MHTARFIEDVDAILGVTPESPCIVRVVQRPLGHDHVELPDHLDRQGFIPMLAYVVHCPEVVGNHALTAGRGGPAGE